MWIYVLKLEHDKYYIGTTYNKDKRIQEHKIGIGAEWTKLYKFVSVIEQEEYQQPNLDDDFVHNIFFKETLKTYKYMLEYGIDNVRGAQYCKCSSIQKDEFDKIVSDIGHYFGMNYTDIKQKLSKYKRLDIFKENLFEGLIMDNFILELIKEAKINLVHVSKFNETSPYFNIFVIKQCVLEGRNFSNCKYEPKIKVNTKSDLKALINLINDINESKTKLQLFELYHKYEKYLYLDKESE